MLTKKILATFFLFCCGLSMAETINCDDFPCPYGYRAAYLRSCNCCRCVGNIP